MAETSPKGVLIKSLLVLNRCHTGKDFVIQKRNDFAKTKWKPVKKELLLNKKKE